MQQTFKFLKSVDDLPWRFGLQLMMTQNTIGPIWFSVELMTQRTIGPVWFTWRVSLGLVRLQIMKWLVWSAALWSVDLEGACLVSSFVVCGS